METFLALGLLGVLAAVGWSLTDRTDRSRPTSPRPLTRPGPDPGDPGSDGIGVAREHEVSDDVTSAGVAPPSLGAWSVLLAPLCVQADLQLPYVLSWIGLESGGNPCDVGDPRQLGPDGCPREMGIAQFYNPDDLQRAHVTGAALRACCVPGNQHQVMYRGRIVRGFSRALARPISASEMAEQAQMTIGLVSHCVQSATRDLIAIHAGPAWSRGRRDFWTLVKLQHGLPGLSSSGLPRVTQKLGRPPASWREFRDAIAGVTLDPGTEKYRAEFPKIFDNAEKCARAFSEQSVA